MDDGFVVTKMTGNIDATSVGQTLININKDIDFGNLWNLVWLFYSFFTSSVIL